MWIIFLNLDWLKVVKVSGFCIKTTQLKTGRVEHKILLIGWMFQGKFTFDGDNYRTNSYNRVMDWIYQNSNDLYDKKKKKLIKIQFLPFPYPEPGGNYRWLCSVNKQVKYLLGVFT